MRREIARRLLTVAVFILIAIAAASCEAGAAGTPVHPSPPALPDPEAGSGAI